VHDAAAAIEFYKQAFGAKELTRLAEPSGRIGHAEIQIGDAAIMLADEYPELDVRSPRSIGGTPVTIFIYVPDVDAVAQRSVAAGAKLVGPVKDEFYGDRTGTMVDPFGHRWMIATRREDLSHGEIERRYDALLKEGKTD
jgi:PhnB protein